MRPTLISRIPSHEVRDKVEALKREMSKEAPIDIILMILSYLNSHDSAMLGLTHSCLYDIFWERNGERPLHLAQNFTERGLRVAQRGKKLRVQTGNTRADGHYGSLLAKWAYPLEPYFHQKPLIYPKQQQTEDEIRQARKKREPNIRFIHPERYGEIDKNPEKQGQYVPLSEFPDYFFSL
ncbi:hypothetical protein HYALB_00009643 [Hymenoscyphus albidus]|uniref:F-box domain-containing protein n=1 Tax=Hymenoscyphus albidus TaxID=595503 RepID=A0A9N9LQT8_9HELO|nr:hypothetical protein HYALB_00009643 [Hymenoscyphus albidus]